MKEFKVITKHRGQIDAKEKTWFSSCKESVVSNINRLLSVFPKDKRPSWVKLYEKDKEAGQLKFWKEVQHWEF